MKQKFSTEIFKGLALSLLFCLGLVVAYQIRGILIVLFIAFILNAGLRPWINYLETKKINRGVGIVLTYVVGLLVFLTVSYLIINTSIDQVRLFLTNIDSKVLAAGTFIDKYAPFLKGVVDLDALKVSLSNGSVDVSSLTSNQFYTVILQGISAVGGQGLDILGKVAGGLVSILVIMIVSIYMLLNKKSAYEDILELTPKKYQNKLFPILKEMEQKLGSWLIGLIVLSIIVGIGTYLIVGLPGLFVEGYTVGKYALIIAIIAALLESIPNLGPAITMVITVFIALVSGAGLGIIIYILIAFIVLQQIESIFFVPMVMKKAIDLNPILSIVGVLAGFEIGGTITALLAVPVIALVQILVFEISKYWKKHEE